jgi:hypothetical protein
MSGTWAVWQKPAHTSRVRSRATAWSRAGRALASGAALLLVACRPPVGVSRVSPRVVSSELTQSALNSRTPSLFSQNVLHRRNLTERFRTDPEGALERLHRLVQQEGGRDADLFALAELSFKHADDTRKREFYLESAVCAWAFLFPGREGQPPDEFDPRLRIAADLYNRGLTKALSSADGSVVDLRSGLYSLPFGQQVAVHLEPDALRWAGRDLVEFVPVAELRVRGLRARYRRPGIGAPLAARAVETAPGDRPSFLGPDVRTPVTALLRIDDARRQLTEPILHGSLEVYSAFDRRSVDIDGREVRLEVEPTAALAWTLSQSPKWRWERRGFFLGDLLRTELPSGITFSQPFRRGRIPVMFVHGTVSSAGRWADMLNDLENDPRVRERLALAATPIAPGVAAHSIIPVTGAGATENATDGVVTYRSAHIDGVESELVIPFSGHSVQGHPLATAEVRRILLEHAAALCQSSGVACGGSGAPDDAPPSP